MRAGTARQPAPGVQAGQLLASLGAAGDIRGPRGSPRPRPAYADRLARDAATDFAHGLERVVSTVLRTHVRSVVLHGSLTLGDYVAGASDIDVLAVTDGGLDDRELAELVAAVPRLAPPAPVDLRVVTSEVAASPTAAPPLELYVRIEPPAPWPEVEQRVAGEPDLVVELSVCRRHGRALSGDSPRSVIGDVHAEWIVAYGRSLLARWEAGAYAGHEQLAVLTACRMWLFAEEGRHASKTAAGKWVLGRAPELTAVRMALAARRGESSGAIEESDLRRLLAAARERLECR